MMFPSRHDNAVGHPSAFPRALRWSVLAAAACALAGAAADPPMADPTRGQPPRLDAALLAKAPEILDFLRKQKYKTFGVLNFEVKRGKGKPRSMAGPLNRRLADRLEVALVLKMSDDETMRLLKGASDTARNEKVTPRPDHRDPKARRGFFRIRNYAPAWGPEKGLTAEALLTGLAHVDRKTGLMSVTVTAFDCRGREKEVCRFVASAASDPPVLTEAGISYARGRGDDPEEPSIGSADPKSKGKPEPVLEPMPLQVPANPLKAMEKAPVGFEVLYDGSAVEVKAQADGDDIEAFVPPPAPGQKVTFRLTHRLRDKETYGVVVKVNGENTIDPDRSEPEAIANRKWMLYPGKTGVIDGFQLGKDKSREFRVVPLSEAEQRYPDKFGTIEVVLFRTKKKGKPAPEGPDDEKIISRGKVGHGKGAPLTLRALKGELEDLLKKGGGDGRGARGEGAILPGTVKESKVTAVAFDPDPDAAASLTIRYVQQK
jgi:hypothetical protein